jgi:hypothetical protein
MKTFKKGLAAIVLTCATAGAMAQVGFSPTNPVGINPNGPGPMPSQGSVRLMGEASSKTGTIIHRDLEWNSSIPLNKTYAQFAPEEKAAFHALYVAMPEGDEPPFPADGMKPVFNAIRKGQEIVRARGKLNLVVTVGPDGKPLQIEDMGGVRGVNAMEMTSFAGSVLLMTKFKPAVCGGKPCTSQFPFVLDLRMK